MRKRILIPAAGRSERFREAGYETPKPFLGVSYKGVETTMLGHVLRSLPNDDYLIGVPSGYDDGANRVVIPHSRGQADTLLQLARHCQEDGPVLIVNSDVVFRTSELDYLFRVLSFYDGSLLVQNASNPAMSYVDRVPHPTRFAEKERISDWGISGAWAHRSVFALRDALEKVVSDAGPGEPYLSHALNLVKGDWYAREIAPSIDMVDWNTPMALKASGAEIRG